jgi:hypothetical protein
MNFKLKLYKNAFFSVIHTELLSAGKFLYLIIVFTKLKVGA